MKVYELMEKLSVAPAGSEVIVSGYFTDNELNEKISSTELDDEGNALKRLEFQVSESDNYDSFFNIYID